MVNDSMLSWGDFSDQLGGTPGSTNTLEVINIVNSVIYGSSIGSFSDVSAGVSSAPSLSIMTMGLDGLWTYSVPYAYTLPVATGSTLGGIKVGSGLTILNGVLSVNSSTHPSDNITSQNILNWNSAYSWGDHSLAGYVTSIPSETDPIFTAWNKSSGISIMSSQVSNFTASVNSNANVAASYALRHSAVTLGVSHGLLISGQEISLTLADATHDGALSSTDWNRFNNMAIVGDYQPLEDQRLSTTDSPVFDTITALYIESTSIVDDDSSFDSIAGFEAANGVLRRYSLDATKLWLGLGPNAYSSDDFYLDSNPKSFIHEVTSEDGSITVEDIVYDPIDTAKHGVDISANGLLRYSSGTGVEVFATKLGVTSSIIGNTLTFTIPDGCRISSAKIRFASYSSLIINMGTADMENSSASNRWMPITQAWREDTGYQLMAVNSIGSISNFAEFTINGLINTTTNHIRISF